MAIGRRRILSTLLTISLALNLFVIGIFITVVVVGGGRMPVRRRRLMGCRLPGVACVHGARTAVSPARF